MYRLLAESCGNYFNLMEGDVYRQDLIKPIQVLSNPNSYITLKADNSGYYEEANEILKTITSIVAMDEDALTHDDYQFINLLEEFKMQGITPNYIVHHPIDEDRMDEYISLIKQILAFEYIE